MEMGLKRLDRLCRATVIWIMLPGALWACGKSPVMKPAMPQHLSGAMRFTVLAPGAKQVFLVGSFNGWTKGATPMKIVHGAGLWSVDVRLAEGEHTFMYVIDGTQWLTPPQAEDFVTDGFGQTNGVVIVR